ncbi:MAG: hypothetical protein ACD_54C00154G0001 [uncultured bacterium]|nr:MAG: hypothetical protein ACD_54C00154G0001 [uncultured bacterium]
MVQQGCDCLPAALAIRRIQIGLAQDHKRWLGRFEGQIARQKLQPECGFIVIATTVAIFWPVENRRAGVIGQKAQAAAIGQNHGHFVMARGRKQQACGRVRRAQVFRQIGPKQPAEIANIFSIYRQARQDRHPAFPRPAAIGLRIARLAQHAVAIQIKPGRHTGIGAQGQPVWVGCTRLCQTAFQCCEGCALQVIVDSGQQQHIDVQCHNRLNCRQLCRVVAALQGLQRQAGPLGPEVDVIGGNPQRLCLQRQGKQPDQAGT